MQDAEKRSAAAAENFKSGCNCCQAVLLAFMDKLPYGEDELMRLGSAFGGGLGRMREVCGTVSAMGMLVGMLDGYTRTEGDKNEVYKAVRALAERFKERNGSIVCRELLAGTTVKPGGDPEARTEAYYKKRPCAAYCADAAELVARYLEERKA